MSDTSVHDALRSGAALVVIEASAGCGKTYQAAAFAKDCASFIEKGCRILVLAHTNSACDVFHTRSNCAEVEIRTIDSFIVQIAKAYHQTLDLPYDIVAWLRNNDDGYSIISKKVSILLARAPTIAKALSRRYPVIICDEHQDCNPHQHKIVAALLQAGSFVRIFGDPMQIIFAQEAFKTAKDQWTRLWEQADARDTLSVGHRWTKAGPNLGEWIQQARTTLSNGGLIDLRGTLPAGLFVIQADIASLAYCSYKVDRAARTDIDRFVNVDGPLFILASHNKAVSSLRSIFNRRFPIWEGSVRNGLDRLVGEILTNQGDAAKIVQATVRFITASCVGFGSGFSDPFTSEVIFPSGKTRRGIPGEMQTLAKLISSFPNHKGVVAALKRLSILIETHDAFRGIKIDHYREFKDALSLDKFDEVHVAHTELSRRRSFLRAGPPSRAISTIHKAKGLECDRVMIIPCDNVQFKDTDQQRCLLYVALSRPLRQLALVLPTARLSPLILY